MLYESICHWPQNILFYSEMTWIANIAPSVSGGALKHSGWGCPWVWHASEGAEASSAEAGETEEGSKYVVGSIIF